ncbi:MAG: hypothetical protein F6K19_18420 [Cyanothece sp. SIO1E1]|nr:hypothetical protein [Cyanothece sp. SIO1E1]
MNTPKGLLLVATDSCLLLIRKTNAGQNFRRCFTSEGDARCKAAQLGIRDGELEIYRKTSPAPASWESLQ